MSVPDKSLVTAPPATTAGEAHPVRVPYADCGAHGCRTDRDRRRGRDRRARRWRIESRYREQRCSDRGGENRRAVALVADAGERDPRIRHPTTIVVPAGTAPSNLQEAQQTVATDEGMLQSAQATLASDTATLAQLRAA